MFNSKLLIISIFITTVLTYTVLSNAKKFECIKTGHPATLTNVTGKRELVCGSNHEKCCVVKYSDEGSNNIYQPTDRLSVFIFDENDPNFGKGYKDVIANTLIDLNLPISSFDIIMDINSSSFTNYQMWENACEN